jgi:hypothetical protein
MGYTSGHPCVLDMATPQTKQTLGYVLAFAGWNIQEAAQAIGIWPETVKRALNGGPALSQENWVRLLDLAGRRAFDYEAEG